MVFSLANIVLWLSVYTYSILFPIAVIEGPIITVIAGFLASTGTINPIIAYTVIVIADLVGDTVYYALGRWGREGLVRRWGKYVGVTSEGVKQLETHFENHAVKTLMIGKATHAIGSVILFAAGVAKVPYSTFIWANLIPTLPKTLALLVLGYYFGKAYASINNYFDYTAVVMIALAVACVLIYRALYKRKP